MSSRKQFLKDASRFSEYLYLEDVDINNMNDEEIDNFCQRFTYHKGGNISETNIRLIGSHIKISIEENHLINIMESNLMNSIVNPFVW